MKRGKSRRLLVGCATSASVWLSVSNAHADEPAWAGAFVSPGAVWSWTNDPVGSSGVSFELNAGYNFLITHRWYSPHVGGLFRFGSVDDGVHEGAQRGLLGAQAGIGPLGMELGFGWRGAMSDFVPQRNGVVIAPFASAGFLFIGPEWFFPVGLEGGKPELSLNFGLKLPVIQVVWGLTKLGDMFGRMPSGRPLWIDETAVVADCHVEAEPRWAGRQLEQPLGLRAEERERLAAFWLGEARGEHASVPSFALLSLALTKLGAPPTLLRRAHRAAIDEIGHAERCFELARRYLGGVAFEPTGLDAEHATLPGSLLELATTSLIDGFLGEGAAAAVARAAHRRATDPHVRAVLARIAREERRHAQLGLDIALFALEESSRQGRPIQEALLRTLRPPLSPPGATDRWTATPAEQAHGRLAGAERARVAQRHFDRALRQLEQRLASRSLAQSCTTSQSAGTIG